MNRVTGIGGISFKSRDPAALRDWYRTHLGIETADSSGTMFEWRELEHPERRGGTVWSVLPEDTRYFEPGRAEFMVNYRVADLDGLLEALRTEGVEVDSKIEQYEYGRFAWIIDPEGNRIELWEPKGN